jgi:hypothetical protein
LIFSDESAPTVPDSSTVVAKGWEPGYPKSPSVVVTATRVLVGYPEHALQSRLEAEAVLTGEGAKLDAKT